MVEYNTLSLSPSSRWVHLPWPKETNNWPKAAISLKAAGNLGANDAPPNGCREAFFRGLKVEQDRFYALKQVHSKKVICLDQWSGKETIEADGMITSRRDIILGVTIADCMPIFILDKRSEAIGLLHSGWKGTGIIRNAVKMMHHRYETEKEDVYVLLGPCIQSCCYNVEHNRAALFQEQWGEHSVFKTNNSSFLDLQQANLKILTDLGYHDIMIIRNCTACNESLGSYRREGPKNYTRMLALFGAIKNAGE